MALAIVPALLLIRSASLWQRIWLIPLVGLVTIITTPASLMYGATPAQWLVLVVVSCTSSAFTRVRVVRWVALVPFILLCQVVPRHMFPSLRVDDPAFRQHVFTVCAHNDGVRPLNFTADLVMPYFGINSLSDDLILLTGEGRLDGGVIESYWLRRHEGRFEFESGVPRAGNNLWRGCNLNGTIWIAFNRHMKGIKRLPEGSPTTEEVYEPLIPSFDLDFGETACDPVRQRLYVTEASKGGMWETDRDGSNPRRYQIGGIVLLPKLRFDGRLVVVNTTSLMVFDPDEGRVVERVAAGLADFGFDVCATNGSVAVPDALGRLRVFEMDSSGRYQFVWGIPLFAPRRVAYSRDCSRLAVTSLDDERVFVVDTASHQVLDVFRAGPALREVVSTGAREFSITDACSITSYQW